MTSPESRCPGIVTVAVLVALWCPGVDPVTAETESRSAWSVAADLARTGPRVPGSEGHVRARALLLEAMREVGLEGVTTLGAPGESIQLTGHLPGTGSGEILLTAHYDTVQGSPGAVDDASGCGVALAAIADLTRTPLRRRVRVVLFDDEERDQTGSRTWTGSLDPEERDEVLAALTLEMMGRRTADRGIMLTLPPGISPASAGALDLAPAWLVHAALEGGRAARFELGMLDSRRSLLAQLALRSGRPLLASDAESLLAVGIPALVLTDISVSRPDPAQHLPADRAERLDPSRLEDWSRAVASIVRRLDALEGRPRHDTAYLVLADRVWSRRDLLWLCFGTWVLSVWRGLPGAWRASETAERRRRGRRYLPGFVFRLLFLLSSLISPVFAAVLVVPAVLVWLAAPVLRGRPAVLCVLGLLPASAYLAGMLWAVASGWISLDASGLVPLSLVGAALIAFCLQARPG